MPQITLQSGLITDFGGDAIICPSDIDLAFRKANKWTQEIYENSGFKELSKELAAIGSCEIGNAVITKGYNLRTKHIIFFPYLDHESSENEFDFIVLHKSLRSVFTLARIYNLQTIAIPLFDLRTKKRDLFEKIFLEFFSKPVKKLKSEEVMDIIIGVSNEFMTLKEVVIYR